MKPCNGFLISIFLITLTTSFTFDEHIAACSQMDVEVTVVPVQNSQQGSLKVLVSSPGASVELFLLGIGDGSKNDQLHIKDTSVKNIPPGEYDLIIRDTKGKYCPETRKVTVN